MFRLLCVTAHPDDEAGSFGGSLLKYSRAGAQTHVICLTPGQAATHRGTTGSDDELAAERRGEFAEACRILEVTTSEVLPNRDGMLDHADQYPIVGDLTRRIRVIRPQVVLTFGPEGAVTAHPDHSMASVYATLAFHWAGRSNRFPEQLSDGLAPYCPQKLYYATASFTLPDRQPVSLAPATAIIDIAEFVELKVRAFKAHTTQAPLVPIFENALKNRRGQELFHLAAAITPRQMEMENDLFAGVEED